LLSVIIPTLNEADSIRRLLDQLARQASIDLEILIVDGGSTDTTVQIAHDANAQVIEAASGRGAQMNKAVEVATGDYLLFLHADTRLSRDNQLDAALREIQQEAEPVAGHFKLNFHTDDQELKAKLRFFEEKSRLNRAGTWSGDQGLLISAETFRHYDGFWQDLPFLEDKEFGRRFLMSGRFITFDSTLTTSGRRFEREGFRERMTVNAIIMTMFHLGHRGFFADAAGLYRLNQDSSRLDPLPFLRLAIDELFGGRIRDAFVNLYRLSRYAAGNFWQIILAFGIRNDRIDAYLTTYDRYIRPWSDHALGHLILMPVLVTCIYWELFRLSYSRRFNYSR